ncbi:LAFA_0E02212g1_1 [Lachancea sp. 'fantastica']|nr:LAFA_0E02212g1_1 [Lachancea sp. 'fantastica']
MNYPTPNMYHSPQFQSPNNFASNVVYFPAPGAPHLMPVYAMPALNNQQYANYHIGNNNSGSNSSHNRGEKRTLKNTSPLRRSLAMNNNGASGRAGPSIRTPQSSSQGPAKGPECTEVNSINDIKSAQRQEGDPEARYTKMFEQEEGSRSKGFVGATAPTQVYKVATLPFKHPGSESDVFMKTLIDTQRPAYHEKQPLGPTDDPKYQVQALADLPGAVERFTSEERISKRDRTVKTSTKDSKANPLVRVAFQEPNDANDSVDLSFDGKAMNRSDVFKIVDSFCQVPEGNSDDDEEENESEEKSSGFANVSILPPEMTFR